MPRLTIQVKGLKETKAALKRYGEKTREAVQESVQDSTELMYSYMVGIVHVDTGALKSSIRKSYQTSGRNAGAVGQVYIDPSVRNPRSRNSRPAVYGFFENRRGGSHAFVDNTIRATEKRVYSDVILKRFSSLK